MMARQNSGPMTVGGNLEKSGRKSRSHAAPVLCKVPLDQTHALMRMTEKHAQWPLAQVSPIRWHQVSTVAQA